MAMMLELDAALVRLRDQHGLVVGAGFLVGNQEVLTCAHVVARALGLPPDTQPPPDGDVLVEFPLVEADRTVAARVACWRPAMADGTGDVAGLKLTASRPAGARPVRLVVADEVWGHPFRVFGFPAGNDAGVWASGRLLARQAMQWVQLEDIKQTGFRVESGFSGAPIWDEELDGVVGMAVAAERRPDVRAAYLIPAGLLVEAWPLLDREAIPPCPYRGLFAFREQDASLFFGREELAEQLADAVVRDRLVTVVGPSGSGKSSLVFAGLVPRLRQRAEWVIADLRPGTAPSPLKALAAALLPLLEPTLSESRRLLELPALTVVLEQGRLSDVVDRVLDKRGARHLALVVDQFEEVLALAPDTRAQFLDLLLGLVNTTMDSRPVGFHLILTLRADFLGQALSHPGLAETLQGTDHLVGPMTTTQLRLVIEGPATRLVSYEPGLVERILSDLGQEAGSLPLLEFALTLLWERQAAGIITHAAYEGLGGVRGALARYAEDVFLSLPETEREEARRVFVQLVRPGEATEHTRRMAVRSDLGQDRWALAQRLAATRLLVTGRDVGDAQTLELVHEALISGWDRLRTWVETDRAFRTWQERVRAAMHEWEVTGRDDGALLRGVSLVEAERWLQERPRDIAESERAFVTASRAFRARELRVARGARRSRRLALLSVPILVVAVVLGVLAYQAQQQAGLRRRQATSRQLAGAALAAVNHQPSQSLLLALNAMRTADTIEARNSLLTALQQDPRLTAFLPATGPVESLSFGTTSRDLVVATSEGSITRWDTAKRTQTGEMLRLQRGGHVIGMMLSPTGDLVAVGKEGKVNSAEVVDVVEVWNTRNGERVQILDPDPAYVVGLLSFDSAGRYLAGATISGGINIWDLRAARAGDTFPITGLDGSGIVAIAMRPDAQAMAFADLGGGAWIWDVNADTPTELQVSKGQSVGVVTTLEFAPKSRRLAAGQDDGSVVLWSSSHARGRVLATGRSAVSTLSFDPSGQVLAVGREDGTINLWDVARSKQLGRTLQGHGGPVLSIAFSHDGRKVATGGQDSTVVLWDLQRRERLARAIHRAGAAVESVTFAARDRQLAWLASDGMLSTQDLHDQRQHQSRALARSDLETVNIVAMSPDHQHFAIGGFDGRITLWERGQAHQLESPAPPATEAQVSLEPVTGLAFSSDGRLLASASRGRVTLWDIERHVRKGNAIVVGRQYGGPIESALLNPTVVAFDPTGRTLAVGTYDQVTNIEVTLWDTNQQTRKGPPIHLPGSPSEITSLVISRDGHLLAAGKRDGAVSLMDISKKQISAIPLPGLAGPITSLAFSPDRRDLAAGSENGTITLWDVAGRQQIATPLAAHTKPVTGLAFSSDGTKLASAGQDGAVLLWNISVAAWRDEACRVIGSLIDTDVAGGSPTSGKGSKGICP
jgi:WD40 repeat protein